MHVDPTAWEPRGRPSSGPASTSPTAVTLLDTSPESTAVMVKLLLSAEWSIRVTTPLVVFTVATCALLVAKVTN